MNDPRKPNHYAWDSLGDPSVCQEDHNHPEPEDDHDPVTKPRHYTSHPSGYECIEITRATQIPNVSAAIKYVWRTDLKNGLEDLRKAQFHLMDQMDNFGPKAELPWTVRDKLRVVSQCETDPARKQFFNEIAWGFLPGAYTTLNTLIENTATNTPTEETDV